MKLIRRLFTKISRPSLYVTCMAALVFVAVGLYSIFSFLSGAPTAGFICLFIAALFLGYSAYAIIILILKYWPKLEKWSEGRKWINRFVMSYDFRTICTTVLSMAINLGFCIFNAVYGFMYMEWWSITMFIYYLMLIVMRSSISARALTISRRFDDDSREDAQLRVYRMAAIMLLVFTVALNILLWELLSQESFGFRHHVLISVVTGIYTVVKVVMAVSNLIYTRGRHDRITHAIRNINMADALVSVMTLLMTFLTRFSDSATAVTTVRVLGTGICIYVAAMSVFMLVNSVVKIKKNRRTIYEMLMDSLNEDFENSLEEPAWEALYTTAQYGTVDYVIDENLAREEMSEGMSDGGRDSLEDTADISDSMLVPPDDLNPGFYKELYAIAGMTDDIPSALASEAGEDEEYEPTPLPAALMPHDAPLDEDEDEDEDGLEDTHEPATPVTIEESVSEAMQAPLTEPIEDEPAPEAAYGIAPEPALEPVSETAAEPSDESAAAEDDAAAAGTETASDDTYSGSEEASAPEGDMPVLPVGEAATEPAADESAAEAPAEDAAYEPANVPVGNIPAEEIATAETAEAEPVAETVEETYSGSAVESAQEDSTSAAPAENVPAAPVAEVAEAVPAAPEADVAEDVPAAPVADAAEDVPAEAEPVSEPAAEPAETAPATETPAPEPVEDNPSRYEVFQFYSPFASKSVEEMPAEQDEGQWEDKDGEDSDPDPVAGQNEER